MVKYIDNTHLPRFYVPFLSNAAFTHAGLMTRYWTKSLYKSIFACQGHV